MPFNKQYERYFLLPAHIKLMGLKMAYTKAIFKPTLFQVCFERTSNRVHSEGFTTSNQTLQKTATVKV